MSTATSSNSCFACTGCGNCCRDHFLPLTLNEGLRWVQEGGTLGLLVDILPELGYIGAEKCDVEFSRFQGQRVFSATCGDKPVFINLELVSAVEGDCRNLVDNKCTIYDRRPSVCRVYPAEIIKPIDLFPVLPATKKCPVEAWEGLPFMQGSKLHDGSERATILAFQATQLKERPILRYLSELLSVHIGTYADHGSLIHSIRPTEFERLLFEANRKHRQKLAFTDTPWRIYVQSQPLKKDLQRQRYALASDIMISSNTLYVLPEPN